MESIVAWIIIILIITVVFVVWVFVTQYRKVKYLMMRICAIEEIVEVPKEKEIVLKKDINWY